VKGKEGVLSSFRSPRGRCFGLREEAHDDQAATASIGIRGTAGYLEVDASTVYFCLCYGEAEISAPGLAAMSVETKHHEKPLLMHTTGPTVRVEPGPFRDHRDAELVMLESLVGREPPFVKDAAYPANKY
jgi:hypothetical protein